MGLLQLQAMKKQKKCRAGMLYHKINGCKNNLIIVCKMFTNVVTFCSCFSLFIFELRNAKINRTISSFRMCCVTQVFVKITQITACWHWYVLS